MDKIKLPSKVYDVLKSITLYVLPALGTFYYAISMIWGIPYAEQVCGTITALITFLGAILGISSVNFYKH